MKDPKDMTREELADKLDALADWLFEEEGKQDENIREAANRLRNSIDRPKVDSPQLNNGDDWMFGVTVNGHIILQTADLDAEFTCDRIANSIRLALGMEGGEG